MVVVATAMVLSALASLLSPGPTSAEALLAADGGPLGVNGPCTKSFFTIPHPTVSTELVYVFEPEGGSECGGVRPTVLFAHGSTARHPVAYVALIDHLVSRGFVVVYPSYPEPATMSDHIAMEDAGFAAGAESSARADMSRVGIVSHSLGGSFTPRLAQLAGQRGWGGSGLFVVPMAPYVAAGVGSGPIAVPAQTRWLTISFEEDANLDNGIATEAFRSLALPADQKTHLTVVSDPANNLVADHYVPNLWQVNDMDVYGVYRPIDAVSNCALHGTDCDAALTDAQVGGAVHPANIVTDDPVDSNPPGPNACGSPANPRSCPVEPWMTTMRDQSAAVGGTTTAQTLRFGDQQTTPSGLGIQTSTSDPEVLPADNIAVTPLASGTVSVSATGAPSRRGRAVVRVTMTDPQGNTATRSFVATFGAGDPPPGGFHPITPIRVLDTRIPIGTTGGRVGAGGSIELQIVDTAGLPAAGVAGVVLNVTSESPTAASFITVWPTGDPRAVTSNLNTVAGQTRANLVVAKVGPTGKVSLFNNSGSTNLVADLAGWIDDGRAATATGRSEYRPLEPSRVLDTRGDGSTVPVPFGPGESRDLDLAGPCAAAGGPLTAAAVNITAVNPTATSHVTVWPSGGSPPEVSNLNFTTGETVPNFVMVPVGTDGKVTLRNNSGTVHLLADLAGCFVADTGSVDGKLATMGPARLADTRFGIGTAAAPFGAGEQRVIQVAGSAGVPPSGARAVIVNLTGTEPTEATHLTVWPAGSTQPLASNVNLGPGQTAPNLAVVKLGPSGAIVLFNNSGSTHVIVDVMGWVT